MTAILCTRTLSGLAAADDAASACLRKLTLGDTVMVDVRRPRNLSAHRRYFALVNLVFQNSEQYPSAEVCHGHLKILAGRCSPVVSKATGETYLIPESISFAAMDQEEFDEFWRNLVKAVCENILPGVTSADLDREIAQLIGMGG